jgi:protein-S-isoprenylcysteine O-methyltransferase Ste14
MAPGAVLPGAAARPVDRVGDRQVLAWVVGALLVAAGEAVRLAGVAAAGTVTRRRSRAVQRLVTYGIFAWTRNPLYVGNFLAWMGVVVASGCSGSCRWRWCCSPSSTR